MTQLGVVTGLAVEAEVAASAVAEPAPLITVSGADSARARVRARKLVGVGAEALLSFGIAGGLAPDSRPGELILADTVVLPGGERVQTSRPWLDGVRSCLEAAGLSPATATLIGSDTAVISPQVKAILQQRHEARAVDMESHAVAKVAKEAGLPFLALRAVADPAERALPLWAASTTDAQGKVKLRVALGALFRRPWELPAAIRLGRETRAALDALRSAVRSCPGLGLPL